MSMTQRYAGMLRRHAAEWDKQAMPVQAEATRQAARHMEDRERELLAELLAERTRVLELEAERGALRAAINRACKGYPADPAVVPSCVQILRDALAANHEGAR